jgi:hypothetical protein
MRKIGWFLMAALALFIPLFSTSYAGVGTDRGVDVVYYVAQSIKVSDTTTYDTLKGATDSVTLISNFTPVAGYLYSVVFGKINAVGDSIAGRIAVKGYDAAGRYLYTKFTGDTILDTLTSTNFTLPLNSAAAPAEKYSVLIYSTAATNKTAGAIFNRIRIYGLTNKLSIR